MSIALKLELQTVLRHKCEGLDPNSNCLEEQQVLLNTETFLQSPMLIFKIYSNSLYHHLKNVEIFKDLKLH